LAFLFIFGYNFYPQKMKFKHLRLGLFLTLLFFFACNEKKTTSQKQSVKLYFESDSYQKLRSSQKQKQLDSILDASLKNKNDSINRQNLFWVSDEYFSIANSKKYLETSKIIQKNAVAAKDTASLAKAQYYIGEYFDDESQVDSAFYYYNISNKFFTFLNDSTNMGKTSLYKAGILYDAGNFAESEVEAINALKLLRKTKRTRLVYECYNMVGLSLKGLNDYESALTYFNKASELLDVLENENYNKIKLLKSRIGCNNNIGAIYGSQKEYDKAISIFENQLKTKNLKTTFPKLYAMLLNNLAYSKMKTANSPLVEKMLFEALTIRISEKTDIGITSSKLNIGEYYLATKDTAKAKQYLLEAYALAKKVKSNFEVLQALRLLTDIDPEKKAYYADRYFATNDSIQNLERNTRNKFARIAYETNLIEEENEILSQENFNILVIGSLFLLVLGSFFLAYRLRVKNRELFFNEQQRQSNEKVNETILKGQIESELAKNQERERIAMELHDGIINSIFTTRFNLSGLETNNIRSRNQLITQLEKTEHEIRQISHDLRKKLFFEDKKLPEMLAEFIEKQQNTFKTVFELTIDSFIDWNVISSHKKIHVYRIVQEAVQNVNKYSKSKMCSVFIMKAGGKISLRIIDQGIGFDPKKNKDGIGLKNIKDRTKKLEGTLEIHTSPGNGTIIEVIF
jgi:signal transduction histidine kinase